LLEITVQIGAENQQMEPEKTADLVSALAQFGYKGDVRVYVTAREGHDFEMLRTILETNEIGWSVVARKPLVD
jgi:hypothetical protein